MHYLRPKLWQKSDFTNTNQRPNYQIIALVFIILLQKSLKKSIWAADLVLCTISQYDACSQSLSYNPGQKGLGHFPFFTCFCMEFAANLQYTLINTALTRFFLHPTPLPPRLNNVEVLNGCKIYTTFIMADGAPDRGWFQHGNEASEAILGLSCKQITGSNGLDRFIQAQYLFNLVQLLTAIPYNYQERNANKRLQH